MADKPKDTIELTKLHYLKLLKASLELEALERAGVNNWEGYQYINWDPIDDHMAGVRAALGVPE